MPAAVRASGRYEVYGLAPESQMRLGPAISLWCRYAGTTFGAWRSLSVPVYDSTTLDDTPEFVEQMTDANRALLALDSLEPRNHSANVSFTVSDAALTYAKLCVLQENRALGKSESLKLQNVLDRLRARLRFYGRSV